MDTERGPAGAGRVATQQDWPRFLAWPGVLAPAAAGVAGLVALSVVARGGWASWLPDQRAVLSVAAIAWVVAVGVWWWERCRVQALTPTERADRTKRRAAVARVRKEERAYTQRVQECRADLDRAVKGRPPRTLRSIHLSDLEVTIDGRSIPLTPRVSAVCDPNARYKPDPEDPDRPHPDIPHVDVEVWDDTGRKHRTRLPAGDYAAAQQIVTAINNASAASIAVAEQRDREIATASRRLEAAEADTAALDAAQRHLEALGPDPMIAATARWKTARREARQAGATPDTWTPSSGRP